MQPDVRVCPETGAHCESSGCTVYIDGRCGRRVEEVVPSYDCGFEIPLSVFQSIEPAV